MKFSSPSEWEIWAKSFPLRAAANALYVSPFTVLEAKIEGGIKKQDILIYGPIGRDLMGDDGMAAAEFAKILAAVPKDTVPRLRISSPGGNVFEGNTIYNLSEERGVETVNDGVAASIAAVILCAGKSSGSENSSVMIHKCYGMFIGNADAVEEFKAQLTKHDNMQAAVFAKKTGKSADYFLSVMGKDKWMTGLEAKAEGFIDSISTGAKAPSAQIEALAQNNGLSVTLTAADRGGQQQQPTTENKMNKAILVALLATHGILNAKTAKAFTETDADVDFEVGLKALAKKTNLTDAEKLQAMQAQLDLVMARAATDGGAQLTRIQAQLTRERDGRITKALDQMVIDCKMTVDEAKDWKPKCIADDSDELLAMLEKRIPVLPGAAPAAHITGGGIAIVDDFKKLSAGAARKEFLLANHTGLREQMIRIAGPKASNTVDTLLVPAFLSDALVIIMQNKLANLGMFSRRFEVDPIKPKATIQVKFAISGATGQQDPTDFTATPASNLDNIPVTMHQESLTFMIENADALNGISLADLAGINAETFANQLSDRFTAVMTTANYGAALIVGSAAAFDAGELKPVLAVAKNYRKKQLILDGGHLAYIQPGNTFSLDWRTNGAYGFDSIAEQNRWTSAAANAVGFVCGPDAIGYAAGPSVALPGKYYESIISTTLKNGMTVQTAIWFDTKARQWFCCHDLMLGVGPGDTTQAEVLVTA